MRRSDQDHLKTISLFDLEGEVGDGLAWLAGKHRSRRD